MMIKPTKKVHATQSTPLDVKINLVFFKASPTTIEPFLQDLARPGFLPVWVGFFAGKANDQVILHDVVNGVALHVHEQEKSKRERGENIW